MNFRCLACEGTGKEPKKPKIFQLPMNCKQCSGTGETGPDLFILGYVRKWREEEHYTYRRVAEAAHAAFDGLWEPAWLQSVGESLCAQAGVDRAKEFEEFCQWRKSLSST